MPEAKSTTDSRTADRTTGRTADRTAGSTASSTPKAADLPTPRLTITPSRSGYPAEGGEVDLLVKLGVDLPDVDVDRKPLALALVLDRSGSKSGEPLESAKAAACAAIEMLLPDDWVSVVAFGSVVNVIAPMAEAGSDRRALLQAVRAIDTAGSTALYAGWAEGLSQVLACPDADASARVVLLSDGGANVGISDAPSIANDVAQATVHGATTTTMGFGRHYDENLMRSMADAGHGNYVFIQDPNQVGEAFQHELSGLSGLRGRAVRLVPTPGLTLTPVVPGRLNAHGNGVRLPDLVAGLERELALVATFAPGAEAPGVVLTWTDAISGAEERLETRLDIEPLPLDEFEALAVDQTVAAQVALARIASLKFDLSQALRSSDQATVQGLLERLGRAIESLPQGDERTAEERELVRLTEFVKMRDTQMAARYSEKHARDRAYGVSDVKRRVQFSSERELHQMKLRAMEAQGPTASPVVNVVVGDITDQAVDVLINSTNRNLFGNAGVDGAVHRRGGPGLTQAARRLAPIDYGQAAFTAGFDLPAQYVVHAVAIPWQGGANGEARVLTEAYRSAFGLAARLGARTVAVTALGTGTYGVPLDVAANSARTALHEAMQRGAPFTDVRFVTLDAAVVKTFTKVLAATVGGAPAALAN